MTAITEFWRRGWRGLRAVFGDDAYERYLDHCRRHHPGAATLERAAFYRAELELRWTQVNRCC